LTRFYAVVKKALQQNPVFKIWPFGNGALRYHNCCVDGDTSPAYFGDYLARLQTPVLLSNIS
jgi:hypothetical protein